MSSHHIVREKQEPALLIMNLDGFESEHLGQILEWSPTVIVSEDIYELADSLAFKIDAVITHDPNFNGQENTRIILTDTDPLEDALKYLVGEKYPAVNIITNKFALKDYALFVNDIDLVVFIEDKKIFPVRSGFSKWQPAGEQVHLLHDVNNLNTSGLIPEANHVLKTEKDGFYSLTFDQPYIFIAESISMNIRKALPKDIPVIHKLAQEIWWPTYRNIISDEQISFMLENMYSEDVLQEQMDEGIEFLLAERNNLPVAFAGYSLIDAEIPLLRIHKLYVLPSEQGKGTGKKLIDHMSSIAEARNCKILELNVNRGNPAQGFYQRSGFEIYQTVDIHYHQFVLNDYVMRKML